MALEFGQKYCKHCGEVIDEDCVVCPKCGKQVEKLGGGDSSPIIVNNNNSASASSAATVVAPARVRKKHSLLFDIFMIILTSGLWIIWMIIRPKYE